MPQSPLLDALRRHARAQYAAGALADALEVQQQVLDAARATGADTADDYLFLGLMLHAAGRLDAGIATLRAGIERFPANAAMQENLGVFLLGRNEPAAAIAACQRAQSLSFQSGGAASANVFDCLADAFNRLGDQEAAIDAGKSALEAKDRLFGAGVPMAHVPDSPPPPFNPHNPAKNVIAYCLWGDAPRYRVPLLENARILPHLFPGWSLRVYHDATVDAAYLEALRQAGVDVRPHPPRRRAGPSALAVAVRGDRGSGCTAVSDPGRGCAAQREGTRGR